MQSHSEKTKELTEIEVAQLERVIRRMNEFQRGDLWCWLDRGHPRDCSLWGAVKGDLWDNSKNTERKEAGELIDIETCPLGRSPMSNNRFVLDHAQNVIDTARSNRAVPFIGVYDTSEKALRESLLFRRLNEFVDKLLVNNQPLVHVPGRDEPFQPPNPENLSLTRAIFHTVKASHLNTRDIAASLEHPFEGKLRRDDIGWQDTTSISLFIKDVECLLRDIYGDFGDDVIGMVRDSTFNIVQEFLRYVRNDLWLEHQSAVDIDYSRGIGVLEEVGISVDHLRFADEGDAYLLDRAREFRAKPDTFSPYSAIFLKAFGSTRCHDSMDSVAGG